MPKSALSGTRIRDHRQALGIKQADLARKVGISASYLNLIEHNRRRIGGKLLVSLAGALQVEPNTLSQGAEAALVEMLQLAAHAPDSGVEVDRIEEFAGRFPGWAAYTAAQHHQIAALERMVGGLNDRLTHDPVLSEKMHEVLGAVSAIRSTASILVATPEINADWRARFHANIDTESRRLAETSAAMAAHFDQLERQDTGFVTPLEAVSKLFEARQFHFREIEDQGEAAIERIIKDAAELLPQLAHPTARAVLGIYAADAKALPLGEFRAAAMGVGFDPAALAATFGVTLPRVFRRLAVLPVSAEIPGIGLVSCDASGAIMLRRSPPGFGVPRFGSACPLWPLFSALSTPGVPVRRQIESAEGVVFNAYAVAEPIVQNSFEAPVFTATMLLVGVENRGDDLLPVGSSCRVCPRASCSARREPSILQSS